MNQSEFIDKPHFLEIVDLNNKPLGLAPKIEVHRQRLPHRAVTVLVYNQDKKIFLIKRCSEKQIYPDRWDVSARGHVWPNEASHDAAVRILWDTLRLRVDKLKLVRVIPAGPGTGFEFVNIFTTGKLMQTPDPNPKYALEGFHYSSEELSYLIRQFREMVTPGLVNLWEKGLPFPAWDSI